MPMQGQTVVGGVTSPRVRGSECKCECNRKRYHSSVNDGGAGGAVGVAVDGMYELSVLPAEPQ